MLCYNCYQTSDVNDVCFLISDLWYDIRYLITVIWQQLSDVRHLLSYNCYQTSDVIILCYITVISRLMSDIRRLIWWTSYQTSDNSYIWQQTSAIRHLMCNVICCYITVIRRLMSDKRHQRSDNSYMTADVWCQTYDTRCRTYTRLLISDLWYIPDAWCLITVIQHIASHVL